MRRLKRRIFAGAICEQIVYNVGDNTKNIKTAEPRGIHIPKKPQSPFQRHIFSCIYIQYADL